MSADVKRLWEILYIFFGIMAWDTGMNSFLNACLNVFPVNAVIYHHRLSINKIPTQNVVWIVSSVHMQILVLLYYYVIITAYALLRFRRLY